MLEQLDNSFDDSLDDIKKSHSKLTPSEKNQIESARRAIKRKNKSDNEQLMAIFQIIYLKIDTSVETISQVFQKKATLKKRAAFSQIKSHAESLNGVSQARKALILSTLKHSTSVFVRHIQAYRKRLKSYAFEILAKEPVSAVPELPISDSLMSPKQLPIKSKLTRSNGTSSSVHTGSAGVLPKNMISRKQNGLKEENRELKGKFERKKHPVRWFMQEMDQLLLEHEHFLKM